MSCAQPRARMGWGRTMTKRSAYTTSGGSTLQQSGVSWHPTGVGETGQHPAGAQSPPPTKTWPRWRQRGPLTQSTRAQHTHDMRTTSQGAPRTSDHYPQPTGKAATRLPMSRQRGLGGHNPPFPGTTDDCTTPSTLLPAPTIDLTLPLPRSVHGRVHHGCEQARHRGHTYDPAGATGSAAAMQPAPARGPVAAAVVASAAVASPARGLGHRGRAWGRVDAGGPLAPSSSDGSDGAHVC